jgi:hypothetical protein
MMTKVRYASTDHETIWLQEEEERPIKKSKIIADRDPYD